MGVGITATIITFNEESNIAEAIASAACCDEVVVVDSGSTDLTTAIAERCGAKVVTHAWEGYSRQKNFAAAIAKNDWILSIDADERVSIELSNEIKALPESTHAAWSMPRRAFYLGAWIGHSGWYPDRKRRLYDRRRAAWQGDFVHEWLEVHGTVGKLNAQLLHFPYRDMADHLARIDRYTRLAAESARKSGQRGNFLKLVWAPPLTFLKAFFLQRGFLDGWRGLLIAYMAGRYVFIRQFRILR